MLKDEQVETQGKIEFEMNELALEVGTVSIDEDVRESRLKWFFRVQKGMINTPVKNSELI